MKNRLIPILLFFLFSNKIFSQEINIKESEEIKFLAKKKILNGLNDLLNFIADESIGDSEKFLAIKQSYSPSNLQLFFNAETIIEDDINPNYKNGTNTQDLVVEKYLNSLDLFYKKGNENTIDFTISKVSNLKKGGFLYLKVYFESVFTNKHKTISISYTKNKRVAELKVDKIGKKWQLFITRIAFEKPNDNLEFNKNDITVKSDTISNPFGADVSALISVTEKEKIFKEEADQKKIVDRFNKMLIEAEDAFKTTEFELALQAYTDLQKIDIVDNDKTFFIKKQIARSKREIQKEIDRKKKDEELKTLDDERKQTQAQELAYKKNVQDAKTAERQRKYSNAIQSYQNAINIKPDSALLYLENIKTLNEKLSIKTELDEMYLAGNFKELKKKYDNFIDKKKIKNNSDFYLGRAKCLIKLVESPKNILEDLNQAILIDFSNSEALRTRAELFLLQNNLPKAIADYTNFLNIEKDSASVYKIRAALRTRTNNISGAFDDYSKAITIEPQNAKHYYDRGYLYTQNKNWSKAISDYSEAIKFDTTFTLAHYQRGDAFFNLNKFVEAGNNYKIAINQNLEINLLEQIQKNADIYYLNGQTDYDTKKLDKAIDNFEIARNIKYDYANAWFKIAELYYEKANFKLAIENYTTAIKYKANYWEAFYKRAYSKYNLNDYYSAVYDFQKTFELDQLNYNALLGEGKALVKLKKYDDGKTPLKKIKLVEKSIDKIYSKDFFEEVFYNLATCYYQTSKYLEAIEEYTNTIKINPQNDNAFYFRGLTFVEINKLKDAVDDFQKAIVIDAASFDKHFAKAKTLYFLNKLDDATIAFENAENKKTDGNLFEFYKLKAYCSFKNEKYNQSILSFETAAKLDSTKCDYLFYKDQSYAYLFDNQPSKAINTINFALKLNTQNFEPNYLLALYYLKINNIELALKTFTQLLLEKNINAQYLRKDKLLNSINKDFRDTKEMKALIKKYSN